MREILSRGKRKDNGKWIEGYYAVIGAKNVIIKSQAEDYYSVDDSVKKSHGNEVIEVSLSTVCQYTGLTDKNGRKIWEGDVVKVEHEKYEKEDESDFSVFPEAVQYERNYAIEFICKGSHCGYWCRNKSIHFVITPNTICNHKIEVIGNIFDNPELIEKMGDK